MAKRPKALSHSQYFAVRTLIEKLPEDVLFTIEELEKKAEEVCGFPVSRETIKGICKECGKETKKPRIVRKKGTAYTIRVDRIIKVLGFVVDACMDAGVEIPSHVADEIVALKHRHGPSCELYKPPQSLADKFEGRDA